MNHLGHSALIASIIRCDNNNVRYEKYCPAGVVVYYKHAKGGNKMTIKNKMVTREQYDKVEGSLANKHAAWEWATDKLGDVREELATAEAQITELTGKLDTAESDFFLVSQNSSTLSAMLRSKLDVAREELAGSEKIAKVAWIVVAVLAVLSALQSVAIFWMLLS